ncbi:MAG: glycosyltransferase family 4 protein [Candidatus Bathyarchaeota archaeon]|nr:glycosyltransferase family 4 protein [Candidatus Bathyarchaeota archaeon]
MGHLKILIFNWRCWLNPAMGGAEVFTREVAERWAKTGHDVTLFTSEFLGCRHSEVLNGVKIIRSGGKYSVYCEAKKYYEKIFSKENYDVVIDEINTVPFFTPKFVKNGEKIVALIHQLAREYWFYEVPFPLSYLGYYFLEDYWLKKYANVPAVTVSESSRKDLLKLNFNRVSVVCEGLNFRPLASLPQKESEPVVVFAGRLKRAKRPDHAIKAFALVKEKLPTAELWVMGDGPFKSELERVAGQGVRFFGDLVNTERRKLIQRSWVLVNPSVREGWGLNIIEANALGVPCVVYDVAGLRDSVVNGETGLLVEAGNVRALATNIISLLNDHQKRQQMSINALKFAGTFDWENTAKEFMNILEFVAFE